MKEFKYDIGTILLTDEDFLVKITDRGNDPDTDINYYTCKPLEFDSIDREFSEDRLQGDIHFVENEGWYDHSPFTGDCWRYPVYMVKNGEKLFVINRTDPDDYCSKDKRHRILKQLAKNGGTYATFHSYKENPYSYLADVCERKHTFTTGSGVLFDTLAVSDNFHGNLNEVSAAFHYRIYDGGMADRIKAVVSLIESKKYDEAETLVSKYL